MLYFSLVKDSDWWRNKKRGIYEYGISPFYLKTFGVDYIRTWLAFLRRSLAIFKHSGPPMLASVGIILWADNYFYRLHRKNPDDFFDEEELDELDDSFFNKNK